MNSMNHSSELSRAGRYALEEALDGELSPETIARLEEHLARCSECAEEMARLRLLKERLRHTCREQAPARLRERITVEYRSLSVSRDRTGTRVTRTTIRRTTDE